MVMQMLWRRCSFTLRWQRGDPWLVDAWEAPHPALLAALRMAQERRASKVHERAAFTGRRRSFATVGRRRLRAVRHS